MGREGTRKEGCFVFELILNALTLFCDMDGTHSTHQGAVDFNVLVTTGLEQRKRISCFLTSCTSLFYCIDVVIEFELVEIRSV